MPLFTLKRFSLCFDHVSTTAYGATTQMRLISKNKYITVREDGIVPSKVFMEEGERLHVKLADGAPPQSLGITAISCGHHRYQTLSRLEHAEESVCWEAKESGNYIIQSENLSWCKAFIDVLPTSTSKHAHLSRSSVSFAEQVDDPIKFPIFDQRRPDFLFNSRSLRSKEVTLSKPVSSKPSEHTKASASALELVKHSPAYKCLTCPKEYRTKYSSRICRGHHHAVSCCGQKKRQGDLESLRSELEAFWDASNSDGKRGILQGDDTSLLELYNHCFTTTIFKHHMKGLGATSDALAKARILQAAMTMFEIGKHSMEGMTDVSGSTLIELMDEMLEQRLIYLASNQKLLLEKQAVGESVLENVAMLAGEMVKRIVRARLAAKQAEAEKMQAMLLLDLECSAVVQSVGNDNKLSNRKKHSAKNIRKVKIAKCEASKEESQALEEPSLPPLPLEISPEGSESSPSVGMDDALLLTCNGPLSSGDEEHVSEFGLHHGTGWTKQDTKNRHRMKRGNSENWTASASTREKKKKKKKKERPLRPPGLKIAPLGGKLHLRGDAGMMSASKGITKKPSTNEETTSPGNPTGMSAATIRCKPVQWAPPPSYPMYGSQCSSPKCNKCEDDRCWVNEDAAHNLEPIPLPRRPTHHVSGAFCQITAEIELAIRYNAALLEGQILNDKVQKAIKKCAKRNEYVESAGWLLAARKGMGN